MKKSRMVLGCYILLGCLGVAASYAKTCYTFDTKTATASTTCNGTGACTRRESYPYDDHTQAEAGLDSLDVVQRTIVVTYRNCTCHNHQCNIACAPPYNGNIKRQCTIPDGDDCEGGDPPPTTES